MKTQGWAFVFLCIAGSAVWMTADAFGSQTETSTVWPMFGHDRAHTGRSEFKTSMTAGTIKWRFAIDGVTQAGPAIGVDGTIYFAGRWDACDSNGCQSSGILYALDSVGHLKWKYQTTGGGAAAPAIGADGTIYCGFDDYIGSDDLWSSLFSNRSVRHLYAINPDGTLRWKFAIGISPVGATVIGADGTIYAAAECGKLYAINPDGTLKWHFSFGGVLSNGCLDRSPPAIGNDGTVYIGVRFTGLAESEAISADTYLYAVAPDGTLKWKFKTGPGGIDLSPAIGADGTIYVGAWDGTFYAVNPDGSMKWKLPTGSGVLFGSPTIGGDGVIYVGNDDVLTKNNTIVNFGVIGGHFSAISSDGKLKWRIPTDRGLSPPAISADGTIYVGSAGGNLYAFNPDGTLMWKRPNVGGEPAIGRDGTIYIRSNHSVYGLSHIGR